MLDMLTEKQGDEIIKMLQRISQQLDYPHGYTKSLNAMEGKLNDIRKELGEITGAVGDLRGVGNADLGDILGMLTEIQHRMP